MSGPRVAIVTLGCKVNAYDTAAIGERLLAAGCRLVAADAPADVVVINSCTVTDAADAEARRLARRARRENPHARLVMTGCYAQTRPAEVARLDVVDHVIGLGRLERLVEAVTAPAGIPERVDVAPARRATEVLTLGARSFPGHTRAFVKVQEGCDLFCTFCIVPMARGRSRSVEPRRVEPRAESPRSSRPDSRPTPRAESPRARNEPRARAEPRPSTGRSQPRASRGGGESKSKPKAQPELRRRKPD